MKLNIRILLLGVITVWLSITGMARAQTVVWSENFDDGNGNSRWYADDGVWQIGSPTIGPETNSLGYRTHSGAYCATTGLTGNYPGGASSRLIRIQTFTVPAANQYPRLRFWHWYEFNNDNVGGFDYGYVEVKAGTNSWQPVSPQYVNFCGDWTYASVDLSAFAGQTVQVAFHIYGGLGGDPGWYVDDIAFETGPPVFSNPQSWANGMGDWYAETGTWQVGIAKKSDGPTTNSSGYETYSGTNCAATLLDANYEGNADSRLISPPFILPPSSSSPYLRFWHWYSFNNDYVGGYDYGYVEIRQGTNAWQTISPQYDNNSAVWTEPFIDLTSYGGEAVQLAFHISGGLGVTAGWYIDDVQVFPNTLSVNTNPAPTIGVMNTNINELVLWQYTPAVSGSGYTFGLSNAPSGMAVSSSGTISWTPVPAQANQTYPITYVLNQSGAVVAWTNFNVTVDVSNTAPTFDYAIGTQTVYATTLLTISDPATNTDIWATSLTYALVSAPSGVGINPNNGLVSWTPTTSEVGANTIYVSATDYDPYAVNSQQLSVTNSFNVTVKGVTPPTFTQSPTNVVVGVGQKFGFTVAATGYPTPTYQWQFSTNGSTWSNLTGATGASLSFGSSEVTNIGYYRVLAANTAGTNTSSSVSLTFLNLAMYAGLDIVGAVGAIYNIQSTSDLGSTNWTTLTNVALPSQPYIYIDYASPTNSKQFYRANPQ